MNLWVVPELAVDSRIAMIVGQDALGNQSPGKRYFNSHLAQLGWRVHLVFLFLDHDPW
jgi:hypothetical protein